MWASVLFRPLAFSSWPLANHPSVSQSLLHRQLRRRQALRDPGAGLAVAVEVVGWCFVAEDVIIILLWLISLLRLRRSIVDVYSISFRLFNCFRLLHKRAKVCVVVGRGA